MVPPFEEGQEKASGQLQAFQLTSLTKTQDFILLSFFFFYIYIFSFSHRSTSRLRKLQDGTQKYKGWVQPEDLVFV